MNTAHHETLRKIMVNDEVDRLISEEYYPFSVTNLTEAMQNMSDDNYFSISVIAGASDSIPDNPIAREILADGFKRRIVEYWEPIARKQAEKNIASVDEMNWETRK